MRRRLLAVLLAIAAVLAAPAAPAAGYTAPDLSSVEEYLAYRVRIARGETTYRARRADLTAAAQSRAREITVSFSHSGWWDNYSRCPCHLLGEIIGTSSFDDGRRAVRHVVHMWAASPGHWSLMTNRTDFQRWGVGGRAANGGWYFVVGFGGGCL